MYIYVVVVEKEKYYREGFNVVTQVRLEEAAGERCLVVPYQEFNLRLVEELRPSAIVMSGFGGHFQDRPVEWFWGMGDVMQHAGVPMLCICGSHQLLAFTYNQDLHAITRLQDEPIRKLDPEEDFPRQALLYTPIEDIANYYVASGFFPIRQVKADPLFDGLPPVMTLRCAHYCEVKQLPPGFELLASSRHSPIEVMRHSRRPLYAVQFHPEKYETPWLDGRRLLENFAAIARRFWADRDPRVAMRPG
jgi:GMP synthase-like glutamine amidotransferase